MIFFLLFFALSLGQISRISLLSQELNIYIHDLIFAGALIGIFAKYRMKPFISTFNLLQPVYVFIGALLVSYAFSMYAFSFEQNLIAFLYLFRIALYFLTFVCLSFLTNNTKGLQQTLQKGFLFYALLVASFSLIQYFLYPDLRNLSYLGWDPHAFRVFGTLLDTSAMSATLGTLLIYYLVQYKKISIPIYIKKGLILCLAVLALLTYSRAFYIASFVTCAVYLFKHKIKISLVLLGILFFSLSLFVLPRPFGEGVNLKRTYTIISRMEDNAIGLKIWKTSPLFGVGYNRLRYVKQKYIKDLPPSAGPDHAGASFASSFVTILASAGVVGLAAFIFLLRQMAMRGVLAGYLTLFLAAFSLMDNVLLHPFILPLYLLVLLVNNR